MSVNKWKDSAFLKDYHKKYRQDNKEKIKQRARRYYQSGKYKESKTKYENSEQYKTQRKYYLIKRNYGLSKEEYDTLFTKQNGCCAICNKHDERTLCLDHDHSNGKNRGLLCSRCNLILGKCNDDIEILRKSIDYLREYNVSK